MSDWVISFSSIDQLVIVRGCATKNEAIQAGLRIASRIDPEITKGSITRCRRATSLPSAARATVWPAPEHQQKPPCARLNLQSEKNLLNSTTHTYWADHSVDAKQDELPSPQTQHRGASYRFFSANLK